MLLHGLTRVAAGRRLVVLHYNHALRGKKSDLDEKFVQKLCLGLGFEFRSARAEWKTEKPSQDSCRKKRYKFFESEMLMPSDRLFLAHHQDDQAETVLLRIFRGTGVKGLAAMRESDGRILRPLLSFRKKEVLSWAKEFKLRWRQDASNQKTDYERNWLRLKILKPLEKRRGKVVEKIAALALDAQALEEGKDFDPQGMELGTGKIYLAKDFKEISSLVSHFSLHRKHGEQVLKIVQKGNGKFSFQGRSILVSARFLYWGDEIPSPKKSQSQGQYFFHSLLGEWTSKEPFVEKVGEKGKKLYQENGIPLFLRDQIPLVRVNGKLHLASDARAVIKSTPSPALLWLLEQHA